MPTLNPVYKINPYQHHLRNFRKIAMSCQSNSGLINLLITTIIACLVFLNNAGSKKSLVNTRRNSPHKRRPKASSPLQLKAINP